MKRLGFVLAMVIGLSLLLAHPSYAQSPGCRYFPETGHNVCSPFLEFFETHGGVDIFSYPITEVLSDNGRQVQYFQKACLEWSPELSKVQLAPLGDLLGFHAPPIPEPPLPDDLLYRYYPQTGHTLSYALLAYFDAHGGVDLFGYPIAEPMIEGGFIVQYFQNIRLEWDPASNRVHLGLLGEFGFQTARLDPGLLAPVPSTEVPPTPIPVPVSTPTPTPTPIPTPPPRLSVDASVGKPIIRQGDDQTVHVYVTDLGGQELEGAQVKIIVHYVGSVLPFVAPPTDATGYTWYTFNIGYPPLGYIRVIDVIASHEGRTGSTQTSFLPWW